MLMRAPKFLICSLASTHGFLIVSRRLTCRLFASVTGVAYSADGDDDPVVKLFTKEGCTLCDKVKEELEALREDEPHTLEQVDITDDDKTEWFEKYKYDIPVLHIADQYWTKHRITPHEAKSGLQEARAGKFVTRKGEPDAGAMERRQAERKGQK